MRAESLISLSILFSAVALGFLLIAGGPDAHGLAYTGASASMAILFLYLGLRMRGRQEDIGRARFVNLFQRNEGSDDI